MGDGRNDLCAVSYQQKYFLTHKSFLYLQYSVCYFTGLRGFQIHPIFKHKSVSDLIYLCICPHDITDISFIIVLSARQF